MEQEQEQKFFQTEIYGYFIHLTFKYFIFKVEGNILTGFDISKLGKLQTMTIDKNSVDKLVWFNP